MPQAIPADLQVGVIQPRDAIAAFERRKLLQPSFRWQDVWQEEHSTAFAVAGVQRLDILQIFQQGLDDKFAKGGTLADFRKSVRSDLVKAGWWGDVEITDEQTGETRIGRFDDRRLALIYDVNVRQSYAAGQWARIERNKARMPFIIYKTMDDGRVRKEHQRWHNLVLPVDHPFWRTHFPPCGWRCRCKAFAIDQAGIDRLIAAGQKLQFEAPPEELISYVNPRTGEVAAVPRGIDPGFAYNPGQARDEQLHQQMLRKAWASSPLAGAVAVAQATFARQEMITAATRSFTEWTSGIHDRMRAGAFSPAGEVQYVGVLPAPVIRRLDAEGLAPTSSVVAVRDTDVQHILRLKKIEDGVNIDVSLFGRLPELLDRPSAVLLDFKGPTPAVLFVVDMPQLDGRVAKVVVELDVITKLKLADVGRAKVPMNRVKTVTVMNPDALQDRKTYRVLWERKS